MLSNYIDEEVESETKKIRAEYKKLSKQLEMIKQEIADYNKLLVPIQDYTRKDILINNIEDILRG